MTENPAQKMVSYLELHSTVVRDGHEDKKAHEKDAQALVLIKKLRILADAPKGSPVEFDKISRELQALGCFHKYGDLRPALDFLKEREKSAQ